MAVRSPFRHFTGAPRIPERVLTLVVAWTLGSMVDLHRCLAGDLEGQIRIPSPPPPESNREEYALTTGEEVNERTPPVHEFQDVVVFLEGRAPGRGDHPRPVISQREKYFLPRVLPVRVGTSVEFPNEDALYHNVFSYSKVKRFDLGRYNTGESRTVLFDQPGLVKLFCEIHTRMRGFVLVLETDAFTVAGDDGCFRLRDIPPGQYRLVVWHPEFEPRVLPVSVRPGTTRIDIQL